MIKTPTALILGAGASNPYGLPLGRDLSDRIIVETGTGDSRTRHSLSMLGFDAGQVDNFCNAFIRARAQSIDAFLARREEFTDLGKLVIADIIKRSENPHLLWTQPRSADDWYPYLWQHLSDGPLDAFRSNKLSVITFNYDRSLETFLREALIHNYKLSDADAEKERQNTIRILHVYGAVDGPYGLADPGWEFREEQYRKLLQASAASIHVIPEGRDDAPEVVQCQELLLAADKICFLGFAYDQSNLGRLRADETVRDQFENRQRLEQSERTQRIHMSRQFRISGLRSFRTDTRALDGQCSECQ